jgi:hypothetical protein
MSNKAAHCDGLYSSSSFTRVLLCESELYYIVCANMEQREKRDTSVTDLCKREERKKIAGLHKHNILPLINDCMRLIRADISHVIAVSASS